MFHRNKDFSVYFERSFFMFYHFSGGSRKVIGRLPRRHGPPAEEELARRQLLRDVISRLDYEDIKKSMTKERRRRKDSHIISGLSGSYHDIFVHAADVILPKIEGILRELRSSEEHGTLRMEQIDISLAELLAEQEGEAS